MERHVYDRMKEIDSEHWWFVARRRIVGRLLSRHVTKQDKLRILEVGCGTGSNIPMLRELGNVDAIEPDEGARAIAVARSGISIKGGFLPHGVELEDGAYDLIVLLDVLEHIADDVGALAALKPKLAPGGKLLVTVPAAPWLWSAHDVAHHHQRRYTFATLRTTLTGAGFSLKYHSHFNTLLFPLIVAARVLGLLLRRDGGDDAMPQRHVNSTLEKIFSAERHWVSRLSMPFGVSLAAVAEPATL